jgi:tellurite resistance protein TerC
MDPSEITYLTFGIVLTLAIVFDLGLLSKKNASITAKKAMLQTSFWVLLALVFFAFLWYEKGQKSALEYLSAYLMEWSLSIDNIFLFILIFTFFHVKEKYYGRVLMIGILIAIILRILFIAAGVALVAKFHWLLYLFGGILVYTGIRMFSLKKNRENQMTENRVYKFMKSFLPLTEEDGDGNLTLVKNGKKLYTSIFVVIVLLSTTDLVFALDSIPAVFGITQDKLVIYTSNIFAVLGLRSLFFLLQGAAGRFRYLQQGIAVVLIFVGLKMIAEIIHVRIAVFLSLSVIVVCIFASMFFSVAYPAGREKNK